MASLTEATAKLVRSKVKLGCTDPLSMVGGIRLNGLGQGTLYVFDTLANQLGLEAFKKFIKGTAFGQYLSGNATLLTSLILGLIIFFLSLIFCLFLVICGKKTKVKNERAYALRITSILNMLKLKFQKMKTIHLVMYGGFILIISICFTIAIILLSGYLVDSYNGLSCDLWQVMSGYYDGVNNLKAPSGMAKGWSGAIQKEKAANIILDNLKPVDTKNSLSKLASTVVSSFYNNKQGLFPSLFRLTQNSTLYFQAFAALSTIVHQSVPKEFANTTPSYVTVLQKPHPNYYGLDSLGVVYNLTTSVSIQTLYRLNSTFQRLLSQTLANEAPLILEANQTGIAFMTLLQDVNSIMKKVVDLMDQKQSTMGSLLIALVVLCCLCPIIDLVLICMWIYYAYMWSRRSTSKRESITRPPKLSRMAFSLYGISVFLFGLLVLIALICIMISQVGNDACRFADRYIYKEAAWDLLPKSLTESQSKKNDIHGVLDSCVKGKGDGDIASETGLRLLVERLKEHVNFIEVETVNAIAKDMNVEDNQHFLYFLYNLTKNIPKTLMVPPMQGPRTITLEKSEGDETNNSTTKLMSPQVQDDMNLIFPFIENETFPVSCLHKLIKPAIHRDIIGSLQTIMAPECLNDFSIIPTSVEKALKRLNDYTEEAYRKNKSQISAFCVNYLDREYSCSTLLGNSTVEPHLYMINATSQEKVFDNANVKNLLLYYAQEDEQVFDTMVHIIYALNMYDKIFSYQIPNPLREIKSKPDPIIMLIKNILNRHQILRLCFSQETCTYYDLYITINKFSPILAELLYKNFYTSNAAVQKFVDETVLPTARNQVDKAYDLLNDSNCQFLGTALKESIIVNACDRMFPSFLLITIVSLVFSIFVLLSIMVLYDYATLKKLTVTTSLPVEVEEKKARIEQDDEI